MNFPYNGNALNQINVHQWGTISYQSIYDVYEFIGKLESLIVKVQQKRNRVILCGDWNINFLKDSEHLEALQKVLVSYNLRNTVTSATRVTKNSASLLDVMIINNNFLSNFTEVLNLGYSDHLGQLLMVSMVKQKLNPIGVKYKYNY
jgi:exonuclease III